MSKYADKHKAATPNCEHSRHAEHTACEGVDCTTRLVRDDQGHLAWWCNHCLDVHNPTARR